MSDEPRPDGGEAGRAGEGDEDMHIHKPKPVRGLGEFLTELGVIVLGIAIALTGEQVIEQFRTEAHKHSVEAQMGVELAGDDGPEVFVRVALSPCVSSTLAHIRAQAEASASRDELWRSIAAYDTPHYTWDSNAYQGALASGVAAHMGPEDYRKWAYIYSVMPALNTADEYERHDGAGLRALSRTGGAITAEERSQVLRAVENLDTDNFEVTGFATHALEGMKQAGVKVSPARAPWALHELQARPMAAACVAALRRALQADARAEGP